ncbi:hypothetical protein ACIQK6_23935 [Streptomyces sp. NPDC091682]|uniref:hypothetical protein n=1 Tax=unclassified Streptomyces TaxID=2593676 RepID=UPI0037175622
MIGVDSLTLPHTIRLVGNPAEWNCALIVRPETPAADMLEAVSAVRLCGLEPLPDEEHEPELLEDGTVRLWLVPTDPDDPFTEVIPPQDMESAA